MTTVNKHPIVTPSRFRLLGGRNQEVSTKTSSHVISACAHAETPLSIEQRRILSNIGKHTECIDQQDNLQKMEYELQRRPFTKPTATKTIKRILTSLLLVDIYCIGVVGFYQTLIKPNVTPFITSLYEIDWIIKEKEAEAI